MGITIEVGKKVPVKIMGQDCEGIEEARVPGNPLGILHLFGGVEENRLYFPAKTYLNFLMENNLYLLLGDSYRREREVILPLTTETAVLVKRALEKYQAKHPDIAPGYCICSAEIKGEKCTCGAAPGSEMLANLMRLDYWMIRVLATIPNPHIYFGWD